MDGYQPRPLVTAGVLIGAVVIVAAAFFITSAIFMVLWNSSVKKAFREDAVKEIDYPTAMGMTLFFLIFISGPIIVYNMQDKRHN